MLDERTKDLIAAGATLAGALLLGAWVRRGTRVDREICRSVARVRTPMTVKAARWASKPANETNRLRLTMSALGAAHRDHRTVARVLLAVGVEAIGETALKHLFDRDRPPRLLNRDPKSSASFASGHAATLAIPWAFAGGIADAKKRRAARGAAVATGVLLGASRVLLSTHWPTDVIGGLLLGTGAGMLADALVPPAHDEGATASAAAPAQ